MKRKKSIKKSMKARIEKSMLSLVAIILVLATILATTISYQDNITARSIEEVSVNHQLINIQIKTINDLNELKYLNEGWYEIRNGYVYYLESFNSFVPLYIKINNAEQQNGLLVIDSDGSFRFEASLNPEVGKQEYVDSTSTTRDITGLGLVSGRATINVKDISETGTYSATGGTQDGATELGPKTYSVKIDNNNYKIITVEPFATGKVEVVVYDATPNRNKKTGEIESYTLEGIGTTYNYDNSEALKGTNLKNWNGEPENMPIPGGKRDSSGCIDQNPPCIYEDTTGTGQSLKKTTTEIMEPAETSTTVPTKIVTVTTGSGSTAKTTVTTTYSDKSTIIINYKSADASSQNIESVTYTPSSGSKIEITGDAYIKIQGEQEQQILKAASAAGITKLEVDKDGVLQQSGGGSKIIIQDSTIYVTKGEFLVSSSNADGTYITYENVKWENGKAVYQAGSKTITKKGDDLQNIIIYSTPDTYTQYVYTGNNKEEYTTVDIWSVSPDQAYKLGTLTLNPIDDPKSQVNGMYPFTVDGTTYYLQTGYGPLGLLGTNWYDEKGNKLTAEQIQALGLPDPKVIENAKNQADVFQKKPTPSQASSQRFFAAAEQVLTEFQGLGYYATLFFDEDSLLEWRENVDKLFATLYLGTEYWSSAICDKYLDGEDEGVAYAETPQGLAQVGAHIEATRTQPIFATNGTMFIYKITFKVRNGDYDKDPRAPEEMNINVVLKGQKIVNVFKQDQEIKRGKTLSRAGKDAIVQESMILYREVCLVFDKTPERWKLDNKELCNVIQESSGEPTTVKGSSTGSSTSGGASGSDINDF